jgi:hyperosmotically inducible protein
MKIANLASIIFIAGALPLSSLYAAPLNADNSGKNQKEELTSQDQSNSESDVNITRSVRQAIMADKSLSTSAQNVKIIVEKNHGSLTLKGPVKNSHEMETVVAKARTAAPNMEIINELEVIK